MRPPRPDIGPTGWLRNLPTVASRVYMNIWFLHAQTGFPLPGELDDLDSAWWVDLVAPTGLDAPYDPACDPNIEEYDEDEVKADIKRWEEWQGYAEERTLPMRTCRHVIDFMLELALIERQETEIGVIWVIASPLPNVDDVLNLSPERREAESLMRWRASFSETAEDIADWIGELRSPGAERQELTTSIEVVAEQLRSIPKTPDTG